MNAEKKVWVVGHKNPDTDSICAALAYAELKNRKEDGRYVAKRAGAVSEETRYVLDYFDVKEPELVKDAGAQVKDIEIRETKGVCSHMSLKHAWEMMKDSGVVTLPIVNAKNKLEGLIVTGDIATSYMDVYDNRVLATARTQYRNIVETMDGELLTGNEHGYFVKGKVVVASGDDEVMKEYIEEDDLVILANRPESQRCALELNASCIVVCTGTEVSEEILAMAKERDCVVIRTPFDSFTAARLINQSMPIKYFMKKDNLVTFELEDYVDDVKEEMAKVRHRDFPVLDENGNYVGMISRRNLLNMKKKQVIIVDHNEKTQAVDGIDGAEILEIIDHHRIGNLETVAPVFFRNQPLGCTGTIIYQMYQEQNEEITKKVAGLLLSAILSDTLMFRSPTCTPVDKAAAEELAKIAGVDIETHAKNMFRAGSNFKNKTIEEIFFQDFKKFTAADKDFGVGQISAMGAEELLGIKDQIVAYMDTVLTEKKLNMVFIMLTDILEETTYLLCAGTGADQVAEEAFKQEKDGDYYVLKGVVSRKKQIIPPFMSVLQ